MPRRTPELTKLAKSYRNQVKRQYAEDYADYLDGFRAEPPRDPEKLSYMAAQAVRFSMASILSSQKITDEVAS